MHTYEVRPRRDKRGFDLIYDALPYKSLIVCLHPRYLHSATISPYLHLVGYRARRRRGELRLLHVPRASEQLPGLSAKLFHFLWCHFRELSAYLFTFFRCHLIPRHPDLPQLLLADHNLVILSLWTGSLIPAEVKNQPRRACHDTLPWLISFSLDLKGLLYVNTMSLFLIRSSLPRF